MIQPNYLVLLENGTPVSGGPTTEYTHLHSIAADVVDYIDAEDMPEPPFPGRLCMVGTENYTYYVQEANVRAVLDVEGLREAMA